MSETTEIVLAPMPKDALEKYSSNPIPDLKRLGQLVAHANRAEIKGPSNMESGADLDRMLAVGIKKTDEYRKQYVDPLNAVVKKINGDFNIPIKALKDARTTIQNKMTGFREAERRRIAEEEEAARKQSDDNAIAEAERLAEQGKDEEAEAVIEDAVELPVESPGAITQVRPVRGDYGGTSSFIPYWEVTITDPEKVPREFCSPDEKKIKEAVDKPGGLREIAGCTIEEKERVVTR